MYRHKRFLEEQSPFVKLTVFIILILASTFLVFFVGILIAMPFFGTDVLHILSEAGNLNSEQDIYIMKYFQLVSQFGVFIIPSLLFTLLITPHFFSYLKLNKAPGMISVMATFLLIFTILPGINWLVQINEILSLPTWLHVVEDWMKESETEAARLTEAFLKTDSVTGLLFNLFMIGVLASIGEELLFRGILIKLLNQWVNNIHVAVIISAILFSMFHLQFFGFLPRTMLGIIFGYLFVWSGSLWLPIFAHFINNSSAVLVYYFYHKGDYETPVEEFGTTENSLLFATSILISVSLMFLIYNRDKNKVFGN